MVITSFGTISDKKAMFQGLSHRRNRLLADIFRSFDYGEGLGSGIDRILESYDMSIFNFFDNALQVVIPLNQPHYKSHLQTHNVQEHQGSYQVQEVSTPRIGYHGGIDRDTEILMYFVGKRAVSTKELSTYFKVTPKTIQRWMEPLLASGELTRTGAGPSTRYHSK